MQNILDNLEKKYLNFKLGEEQRETLLSVFSLLQERGFNECAILGRAGTGKTTISELIIHFLEDYLKVDYRLVTPTHKSKRVLADRTKREVTTIHQLLKLKPDLNVLNLDLRDLKFCTEALTDNVPANGVIIIDECSMINDDLYTTLVQSCSDKNCKIIWQGDARQLAPVEQRRLSKAFNCDNVFELSEIYRQQNDNPILEVLETLRKRPIFDFKTISSSSGSLILYDSWKALIRAKIGLFRDAIAHQEPNEVKLLAYTNRRVEAFNIVIRNLLFENPDEFEVGDFLMGYDNTQFKNEREIYKIDNSNDFRVLSAKRESRGIGGIALKGWVLDLYDYDRDETINVFCISRDNNIDDLQALAENIENVRQSAVLCKNRQVQKGYWRDYFNLIESFITPFDLYYGEQMVKKKTVDYGYAMTVHKSQSSSYDNVLVDMENIWRCSSKSEIRQLQYVALSRTRNNIYMLI